MGERKLQDGDRQGIFSGLDSAVDAIQKAERTKEGHDASEAEKCVQRLECVARFADLFFSVCSDVAVVITLFPLPPVRYQLYIGGLSIFIFIIKMFKK